MPQLPSTPRPSKTQSLADLYRTVDANPPIGIRSHIINRAGKMAWGLSKDAGTDRTFVNFLPNTYQTNFGPNGGGPFTAAGLNYAAQTLKHDNTPYRG